MHAGWRGIRHVSVPTSWPYTRGVDWATISALATAGGTLLLAVVTFASVRSAKRAARVAETLPATQRPLLQDDVWFNVPGGQGGTSTGRIRASARRRS